MWMLPEKQKRHDSGKTETSTHTQNTKLKLNDPVTTRSIAPRLPTCASASYHSLGLSRPRASKSNRDLEGSLAVLTDTERHQSNPVKADEGPPSFSSGAWKELTAAIERSGFPSVCSRERHRRQLSIIANNHITLRATPNKVMFPLRRSGIIPDLAFCAAG